MNALTVDRLIVLMRPAYRRASVTRMHQLTGGMPENDRRAYTMALSGRDAFQRGHAARGAPCVRLHSHAMKHATHDTTIHLSPEMNNPLHVCRGIFWIFRVVNMLYRNYTFFSLISQVKNEKDR